jgi:predicted amidophosphoribosyltransferase
MAIVCTKRKTTPAEQLWKGYCRKCGSEFEAQRSDLTVEMCPREHYEFAHHNCSACGGQTIFYPVIHDNGRPRGR